MGRIQRKKSPSYPPGIYATPMAYFLTPHPTVEHPERHWDTGDTDEYESYMDESKREHPSDIDVDESGSDEGERESTGNTDVEATDLGKPAREEPDDTDVKESDSGNKDPYEDEDEDEAYHITIISWNDPQNSYKIRSLTSFYLRYTRRNRPYKNVP